jgi:hypothetical protein
MNNTAAGGSGEQCLDIRIRIEWFQVVELFADAGWVM